MSLTFKYDTKRVKERDSDTFFSKLVINRVNTFYQEVHKLSSSSNMRDYCHPGKKGRTISCLAEFNDLDKKCFYLFIRAFTKVRKLLIGY